MTTYSKQQFKLWVGNSPYACHWVAFLYSKIAGLLAWAYRIRHLGRSHIALTAKITGWSACSFGRNVVVGARTWVNVNHRPPGKFSFRLGDNAFIGQDNFFTTGKLIDIGPYCLTGAHCAFIGSTHIVDNPMLPYGVTGASEEDSIIVGSNCFFGYGAVVLGNVRIGHGSIVGAGAVVRHDVPPFSLVVGNPAKAVKHFDFSAGTWVKGPRPALETIPPPSEHDYLRHLILQRPYLIQPVSAASAWLGDI